MDPDFVGYAEIMQELGVNYVTPSDWEQYSKEWAAAKARILEKRKQAKAPSEAVAALKVTDIKNE